MNTNKNNKLFTSFSILCLVLASTRVMGFSWPNCLSFDCLTGARSANAPCETVEIETLSHSVPSREPMGEVTRLSQEQVQEVRALLNAAMLRLKMFKTPRQPQLLVDANGETRSGCMAQCGIGGQDTPLVRNEDPHTDIALLYIEARLEDTLQWTLRLEQQQLGTSKPVIRYADTGIEISISEHELVIKVDQRIEESSVALNNVEWTRIFRINPDTVYITLSNKEDSSLVQEGVESCKDTDPFASILEALTRTFSLDGGGLRPL